ncbi:hypothetical protein [Halobacteriovorax sp. JY17]|uniref:hypothetical protein n=1 Tax=Halobacteriovorax sp. JY17 TaxID=2014617 RepID=UPI000C59DE21|nr:hypothetical protein [Halobacteriovorax sp. JY17]PIK13687.1 MAG: hypothetical protein CES88_15970 [Halobacteriovorax sp. JY17]
MNKLLLYFRLQYRLFLILVSLTTVPLLLVYLFSPYEWKNLYWFFLTFIFALKVVFYKEAPYKKKISSGVRDMLTREMKRVPSKMEVVNRVEDLVQARDAMLVASAVIVVLMTVIFGKI